MNYARKFAQIDRLSECTCLGFINNFLELEDLIKSKIDRTSDGSYVCLDCGKFSKWKTNILEHIEGQHVETPGYNCNICSKFCKTKNALRSHRHREHKDKIYI